MAKDTRLYVRVSEEFKNELQELAKGDNRTLSNYVLNVLKNHIDNKEEDMNMKKLIVMDHGKKEELFTGTLEEVVEYLKKNEDVYNWQLDEDENAEQPELDEIYDWSDLEREFDRISLGWWDLVVE